MSAVPLRPPNKHHPTTPGELLFRDYLKSMGYKYEFERQVLGRRKTSDYTVTKDGIDLLFDVKDFDENLPPIGFNQVDPYTRIREKINQGRAKFKEFKEFSCSLVLYNAGRAFVELESMPIMFGAMYGDAGFVIPVKGLLPRRTGKPQAAFLRRGKMIAHGHPQNSTISALITLRHVSVGMRWIKTPFSKGIAQETLIQAIDPSLGATPSERQLGIVVWENAWARIPLSRELFNGPYDMRWGYEDNCPTIVFRGEKLPQLEEL